MFDDNDLNEWNEYQSEIRVDEIHGKWKKNLT